MSNFRLYSYRYTNKNIIFLILKNIYHINIYICNILKKTFFFIIILYLNLICNLRSEDYYDFQNSNLPGRIDYEKKRSVCFFKFRNIDKNLNFDYLSKGLPSVISSSLTKTKYTFDPNPTPLKIQHDYNTQNLKPNLDKSKFDPRYIPLEVEIIKEDKAIFREEAIKEGKEKDCFYMVTGEFKLSGLDNLEINVEVTERRNGTFEIFKYKTGIKRAFQELKDMVSDISSKSFLTGFVEITIISEPEKDVFVYLDNELQGKTPLEKIKSLPGKHKILLIKDGFKRIEAEINIENSTANSFKFQLTPILNISNLSISTDPPEADIFLGSNYLGKSPIIDYPIPKGQNRIKISKEGFIDKFIGIDVVDSKKLYINHKLRKGDSDNFYKYNNNLFLDYSNFDFGLYSLYGSLMFYSMYMYSGYRESTELDRLNGKAIFTTFTFYQGLSTYFSDPNRYGNAFLSSLAYQQTLVNQVWDSTQVYRNIQNLSVGGTISMLFLSVFFYSRGLNSENFEIGYSPQKDKTLGSDAYFKYIYRF